MQALTHEQIKTMVANGEVKMVLGSTFTLALMRDMTMPLHTEKATWSDIKSLTDVFNICGEDEIELSFIIYGEPVHLHFINAFGHQSTCDLIEARKGIHIKMNRVSLCLDEGWTLIIPQYRGARLPEGATELPQGAELVPVKVVLGE